jgi:hypothetical protein
MLERKLQQEQLSRLAVGDDGLEIYDTPLGGPWIQGLCDAGGRVGKPEKQIFHDRIDGHFEFLRVFYCGNAEVASSVRALSAFACPHTQTAVPLPGPELATALNSGLADAWRRSATWTLRPRDQKMLLGYWMRSPLLTDPTRIEKPLKNVTLRLLKDWARLGELAFVSQTRGGLGCVHPNIEPCRYNTHSTRTKQFVDGVVSLDVLQSRIKRKIPTICPELDLSEYIHTYAKDVAKCSVQTVAAIIPTVCKDNPEFLSVCRVKEGYQLSALKPDRMTGLNTKTHLTLDVVVAPVHCRVKLSDGLSEFSRYNEPVAAQLLSVIDTNLARKAAKLAHGVKEGVRIPGKIEDKAMEMVIAKLFGGSRMVASSYVRDHGLSAILVKHATTRMMSMGINALVNGVKDTAENDWLCQAVPNEYSKLCPVLSRHTYGGYRDSYYLQVMASHKLISIGNRH